MAAKMLVADEILLATTAEAWEKPSVEAMGRCHPGTGVAIGPASSPDYDH